MGNTISVPDIIKAGTATISELDSRGIFRHFLESALSKSEDCGRPLKEDQLKPYLKCLINRSTANQADMALICMIVAMACLAILAYLMFKKVFKYTSRRIVTQNLQMVSTNPAAAPMIEPRQNRSNLGHQATLIDVEDQRVW